jgi:hypothetical protein
VLRFNEGSSSHASAVTTQPFVPARDLPAILAARDAITRFKKDYVLLRHGCMLFGRLSAHDGGSGSVLKLSIIAYTNMELKLSTDSWRRALLSIRDPSLLVVLMQVRAGTAQRDQETLCWCDYALRHISNSGGSTARPLSKPEAARRIQGLYRSKKAREHVRSLASAIYHRLVDPASGQAYYYNTRTGTASWSMPSFITTVS